MGIDSAEVKIFLSETQTVILWVEVFPTFKRHVMGFEAPFAFSFVIFSSEYYRLSFCKRAFLSFVVIADFQSALFFFFFYICLLYGTSLGECMWIWQIYHIMSSSHLKPVRAFNTFFYFVVFILLLFCRVITDMKIILLNLTLIYFLWPSACNWQ